jgi:AraC-like DNA-binding protein
MSGNSNMTVFRSSQLGEMKLHWFRLCPELLTGFFTLHEQHYLGFIAPKRKAVLQIFPASHDVATQFATLSKELSRGNSLTSRGRMLAIIVSLLRHELMHCEFRQDSPLNAGERFKQLIAAAPAADIQNMSIAELARECGCSERHFSRLFRASFGFSLPASVLTTEDASGLLTYRLRVQKQPGTLAHPLLIRIHLPNRATLDSSSMDAVVQDNDLLIKTDLRTDVLLDVAFSFP